MTPQSVQEAQLFELPLTSLSYAQVSAAINAHLQDDGAPGPLLIDATNTMGMAASCQDPRLHQSMRTYDYLLPDGMPLVWAMRRRKADVPTTTAGPHVVASVLEGLDQPTAVALIGGFPDEHERIAAVATERYPNAKFTLMYDAPPTEIDDSYAAEVARLVEENDARLVFICLGVPRQYYLSALLRQHVGDRVVLSVGGAFRYMIGDTKVPPRWVQQSGLWWAYRLLEDPKRLASRYARYNTLFLYHYARRELVKSGSEAEEGSS